VSSREQAQGLDKSVLCLRGGHCRRAKLEPGSAGRLPAHPIGVELGSGRAPGVERRRDLLATEDPDGVGKESVDREHELVGGDGAWKVDVGRLAGSVDPSVGAARAGHRDGFLAGHPLQGELQLPLDRAAAQLPLPASERSPEVGNDELEAHDCMVVGRGRARRGIQCRMFGPVTAKQRSAKPDFR